MPKLKQVKQKLNYLCRCGLRDIYSTGAILWIKVLYKFLILSLRCLLTLYFKTNINFNYVYI